MEGLERIHVHGVHQGTLRVKRSSKDFPKKPVVTNLMIVLRRLHIK
jgi:hypothetical protein